MNQIGLASDRYNLNGPLLSFSVVHVIDCGTVIFGDRFHLGRVGRVFFPL